MRSRLYFIGTMLVLFLSVYAFTPLSAKTNRTNVLYWHGDPSEKKVALTFDDGPNEPYTSQILRILEENHVRATFFMVGKNVEVFPDAARAIVQAGHAIGNHTYDHHNLITKTDKTVREEILKTEDIIERTTGRRTILFRPPYGDKDMLTVRQTRRLGYIMVEWSVSAEDWRKPGTDHIVRNVVKHVANGSIVLLHDGNKWHHGSDRSQTVAALPVVIQELRKQGYDLVTVPELLKISDRDWQLARSPNARSL